VLPSGERRTLLHTALDAQREPMFLLLSGAATLYWLLGDTAEALALRARGVAPVCA
jgi:Ca2+-transporting ATPase